MKIGIVGFQGSGKTTIFNALSGSDAPTGFGGGKVNLGTIKVPDPRVDRLAEIDNPKKITYAEVLFAPAIRPNTVPAVKPDPPG